MKELIPIIREGDALKAVACPKCSVVAKPQVDFILLNKVVYSCKKCDYIFEGMEYEGNKWEV